MIRLLAIFSLGLIGILVEMCLGFLKEANALRIQKDQVHLQIQTHLTAIEEARNKTEEIRITVKDLETKKKSQKGSINDIRTQLAELKEKEQRRHPTRFQMQGDKEDS